MRHDAAVSGVDPASPRKPVLPPPKLLSWRPLEPPRGSLIGFARIQFGSGLIVRDIGIHLAGSRVWASPPAKPWVRNNQIVLNEVTQRPQYEPTLEFSNHGVRSRWSRQVLKALREAHPEIALP